MRRTVAGWLELFAEQVTRPLEDRTRTIDEMGRSWCRAPRRSSASPDLLTWLFQRHLEAGMDAQNVASMETGLAREGLLPPRPAMPPAIAFVDLAGYTRLTETGGDELAARSAARLAELADAAARPHGGRLVKLLGDGAMLHFREPKGAVRTTLDLIAAIADAGLPPGHAGISAGSVVSRDGDFFGHTVKSRGAPVRGGTSRDRAGDARGGRGVWPERRRRPVRTRWWARAQERRAPGGRLPGRARRVNLAQPKEEGEVGRGGRDRRGDGAG
jgi:hypothetical protein